ncbi:MAG: hypothetical protein GIW98_03355 [Candidatus Eremiobacteraeota bacterium]|nr:hypothetical protein [Candidatus Eremiobacteraeota bacterium]
MYAAQGFELCDDGTFTPWFDKIALFTKDGVPTHAARQLRTGQWTSKLGALQDISHAQTSDIPPVIERQNQLHALNYGAGNCILQAPQELLKRHSRIGVILLLAHFRT